MTEPDTAADPAPVTFVRVETVYVIECEICGKVGQSRDPALADDRALEHSQERWHG